MKATATHVMTLSVYGVEDALYTVRLLAAAMVDGSTSGNSITNNANVASTMLAPVATNAHPSRRAQAAATPATNASAATADNAQPQPSWCAIAVQSRNPPAIAMTGTPNRADSRPARRRVSPSVFSARNTAPCNVNRPSVVSPPSNAYGLSRVKKPPTYSWFASRGTPRMMLPNATPQSTAGT